MLSCAFLDAQFAYKEKREKNDEKSISGPINPTICICLQL
jgi:hypothetical protein